MKKAGPADYKCKVILISGNWLARPVVSARGIGMCLIRMRAYVPISEYLI